MADPGPAGSRWQSPDQCRFQQSDPPQLAAVHDDSKLLAGCAEFALLPPAFQLRLGVTSHTCWLVDTCGYRPPPLLPTGPARAPPPA